MIPFIRKQPELLFDISDKSVADLLNNYSMFIKKCASSVSKDRDISIAIESFKHSIMAYNSSSMGDFLSYSELNILKALTLKNGKKLDSLDERKVEIEHYLRQLKKFKISLTTISTRVISKTDKEIIMSVIGLIKSNIDLKIEIFNKKKIPFEQLFHQKEKVKLIKKHEQYVLAIMLLHMYEYKHLYSFVN